MAPTAKPPTTPAAIAPPFRANAGSDAETDKANTETAASAPIVFIRRSICVTGQVAEAWKVPHLLTRVRGFLPVLISLSLMHTTISQVMSKARFTPPARPSIYGRHGPPAPSPAYLSAARAGHD